MILGAKGSNCHLGLVLRCDANEMLLKANGKRRMELMELEIWNREWRMRNRKIKWELMMVNSFFPRRFTVFERE